MLNLLSHEFLWQPTPVYYVGAMTLFMLAKKRWKLKPITIIPFLSLPLTADYISKSNQNANN